MRAPRLGVDEVTLEIPGEIIDPGEDPATAAVRELREGVINHALAVVSLQRSLLGR